MHIFSVSLTQTAIIYLYAVSYGVPTQHKDSRKLRTQLPLGWPNVSKNHLGSDLINSTVETKNTEKELIAVIHLQWLICIYTLVLLLISVFGELDTTSPGSKPVT